MEILQIIAIGLGSGMLLSVLSIAFFNSSNAEKFPLGGFLPALWLVSDLGGSSQLVEGGLLMMGGMLGYYLILAMWRGRPKSLSRIIPESSNLEPASERVEESNEGNVIQGKPLADFLKTHARSSISEPSCPATRFFGLNSGILRYQHSH